MIADTDTPAAGPVEEGPFDPVSNWIQHQYANVALRSTLDLLEGAGIPVLPVKGVVLARTLYDDVADRPMVDIDLRVRPRDFARVVELGRGAGFQLEWSSAHRGAVRFRHDGILVEIESSVGPPGVCALTIDAMLARAEWHEDDNGLRFRIPEIHDHAIHLCINVFKDFLKTRPWALEDLRRIVRKPTFDRDVLLTRADAAEVTTAVFAVARFLRRDAPWNDIATRLDTSGHGKVRRNYLALYDWLRARDASPIAETLLVHAGSDSRRRAARGLVRGIVGVAIWKARREWSRAHGASPGFEAP